VLFIVTILSHLPFTSRFLYHYDSVQFALALEKYDVYLHQPHPPGYFLYVMAGKLLDHFIQDASTSFIAMSVVASGLTVVAIYYLARAIFNGNTAWWARWLAVTSPLLWFYGEVALSYIVAAFFKSSIFYGYRHIQYNLRDYQVYLVDLRVNERGERWHIFGAVYGRTVLADAPIFH